MTSTIVQIHTGAPYARGNIPRFTALNAKTALTLTTFPSLQAPAITLNLQRAPDIDHIFQSNSNPILDFIIDNTATVNSIQSNIRTPVKACCLYDILEGYDNDTRDYLYQGFLNGFKIPYEGDLPSSSTKNLKSAYEMPQQILEKINTEITSGRIAGPFSSEPFKHFIISPVGVVPKKTPGKYRFIHHLSHPRGFSVNDGISEEFSSVQYSSVSDAISLVRSVGPGAFMAKTDIESAFRIMPIHPSFHFLLGFKFQSQFYYDKTLPMGLASSCQMFETLSSALEWAATDKLDIPCITHILDDFFITAPDFKSCKEQLDSFLHMCNCVGIPIAQDKTTAPDTAMSFAGIELDSVKQEARLPKEKIDKCLQLIDDHHKRKKITLKELQSIIGLLNFCCNVIPTGRVFLRRLINLTIGISKPSHKIRLNKESRADLTMWRSFLIHFNGKGFFHDDGWSGPNSRQLFTDSSGSLGFGAVLGNKWFYGAWPQDLCALNIAILELYPIVVAFLLWQDQLRNKKVTIHSDNEALTFILNKCTSKDTTILGLLRILILTCLNNNIMFRAEHIPGTHNVAADALSRFNLQGFRQAVPWAEEQPTKVPDQWQPHALILI